MNAFFLLIGIHIFWRLKILNSSSSAQFGVFSNELNIFTLKVILTPARCSWVINQNMQNVILISISMYQKICFRVLLLFFKVLIILKKKWKNAHFWFVMQFPLNHGFRIILCIFCNNNIMMYFYIVFPYD